MKYRIVTNDPAQYEVNLYSVEVFEDGKWKHFRLAKTLEEARAILGTRPEEPFVMQVIEEYDTASSQKDYYRDRDGFNTGITHKLDTANATTEIKS